MSPRSISTRLLIVALFVGALPALGSAQAYYDAAMATSGLVHFYNFGAASYAKDNAGTKDGTYYNLTLGQPGPRPADGFNGFTNGNVAPLYSSAANSYTDFPNPDQFGPTKTFSAGISEITVSFWFKMDSAGSDSTRQILFGYQQSSGFRYNLLALRENNGYLKFYLKSASGNQIVHTTSILVTDSDWHNVVFSWDGSVLRMYFDGGNKETATSTVVTGNLFTSMPYMYVGKDAGGTSSDLDGAVDALYLFDRVLSDQEISDLYDVATTGIPADPCLHYDQTFTGAELANQATLGNATYPSTDLVAVNGTRLDLSPTAAAGGADILFRMPILPAGTLTGVQDVVVTVTIDWDMITTDNDFGIAISDGSWGVGGMQGNQPTNWSLDAPDNGTQLFGENFNPASGVATNLPITYSIALANVTGNSTVQVTNSAGSSIIHTGLAPIAYSSAIDFLLVGDNDGEVYGIKSVSITVRSDCAPVDTTPPVVTTTTPLDGSVTQAASTTVTAIATDDDLDTVIATNDAMTPTTLLATGNPDEYAGSVALDLEGENEITVTATDGTGNEASTSVLVYRDQADPVVTISPAEGMIVSTAIPSFSITVTDQTALSVSIDGGVPFTAEVPGMEIYGVSMLDLNGSIPMWVEGSNSIEVVATDAAGNVTTVTRTVILDSTAPVVEITDPTNGDCFKAGDMNPISISADIDDATATDVTGALTGSLMAGGGTLMGTVNLVEGPNEISVTATNPGLGLDASDTITVTLDTILPTVEITSPEDGDCVRGMIEFHATAADTSPGTVASTTYFVDGVALPVVVLYLVDTTLLSDGPHVLRVDATDSCGNVGTTSITIEVDNTAPVVTITNPIDLSWISGTMVPFDATASDAESGLVSITMKAADQAPATDGSQVYMSPVASDLVSSTVDSIAASGMLDGDMEFEVTAVDCAGNSTTVSITLHVDNTAPAKAITSPSDGATVRCNLDVEATVDDPNLANVYFEIDGVATPLQYSAPYETSVDTRNRLDGDMTIVLVATDTLGNVSTCEIHVTVDNLEVEIKPETLQLKSRGGNKSVTAKIEGQSAALLLGLNPADITLCVPGGSPIPATLIYGHQNGWHCDHENQSSHRGRRHGHRHRSHGCESEVKLKFDRQLLIAALRTSCNSNRRITLTIKATVGGQTYVLGSDTIRVKSRRR